MTVVGGQHHHHNGFALLGASWEEKDLFWALADFRSSSSICKFYASLHLLILQKIQTDGSNDHNVE